MHTEHDHLNDLSLQNVMNFFFEILVNGTMTHSHGKQCDLNYLLIQFTFITLQLYGTVSTQCEHLGLLCTNF